MRRRDLLKLGALAGATAAVPLSGALPAARAAGLPTLPLLPFQVPLALPPVARPVTRTDEADTYHITMRPADVEIIPGTRTRIWGYDGIFPGPTIKARAGKRVIVVQRNQLDVPTSVHLHGGIQAARDDGYPMDMIMPGESKTYHYPNEFDAAPLWYHEHAHGNETKGVYMGLAGAYLVSDEFEDSLPLPRGSYDVPLVIADRLIAPNGSLVYFENDHGLGLRTMVLVNGRPQPYFRVAARQYRFRLINASNDRIYRLRLSDDREMVQIGADSGLLPEPVGRSSVELWPADRVDVVIDFSAYRVGSSVTLRNPAGNDPLTQNIMRFDVVRTAPDDSHVPDALRPLPATHEPVTEREFVLGQDPKTHHFVINGKMYDPNRVDERPRVDTTEIWRIHNSTPESGHNFHTHLARFRLLDRDGKPPSPGESGLKDTVAVRPGETVRIAPRFSQFTGRYVYHCHLLAHAHSMMGTMQVMP